MKLLTAEKLNGFFATLLLNHFFGTIKEYLVDTTGGRYSHVKIQSRDNVQCKLQVAYAVFWRTRARTSNTVETWSVLEIIFPIKGKSIKYDYYLL